MNDNNFYLIAGNDYMRMIELYDLTKDHGLLGLTFHGQVKTADAFLRVMEGAYLYAVIQDGEVVGYAWLNRFSGRAACSHLCLFHTAHDKVGLGRAFTKMVFDAGHITTLIGLAPATYYHAAAYALRIGYHYRTTIEDAVEVNGEVTDMDIYVLHNDNKED